MAAHGNNLQPSGGMDISQHKKTWAGFITFVKLSMLGILLIMLFLMVFRTH